MPLLRTPKALSAALHAQPDADVGKLFGQLRKVTLSTKLNALQYLKYFERLQQEMTQSLDRLADCTSFRRVCVCVCVVR